jgi:chitosanase
VLSAATRYPRADRHGHAWDRPVHAGILRGLAESPRASIKIKGLPERISVKALTGTPRGAAAALGRAMPAVAALGLALGLALGSVQPAEAVPVKTTLSLAVSKSSVAPGGSIRVTATLKRGSAALKQAAVGIQKRDAGTGKWLQVNSARTDAEGKLVVQAGGLKRTTELRAVFSGTSRSAQSVSPKKRVSVKQQAARTIAGPSLRDAVRKEMAMRLVSSAENSTTRWKEQYRYIEDIGDGRGYTAGIIGFCSGTGDMLDLIEYYERTAPGSRLGAYLPALRGVNCTGSRRGLGGFAEAWRDAADHDPLFRRAQDHLRDAMYFEPAVSRAAGDGLGPLGQFIYYDTIVMHGPGGDPLSFGGIRSAALKKAKAPARGGNEATYLEVFLDARDAAMKDPGDVHQDLSRTIAQRRFLAAGNLNLDLPLAWTMYGDGFSITSTG